MKVILMIYYIFIDGVGFGKKNRNENPFARFAKSVLMPLGGRDFSSPRQISYVETDACMGIEGLPQSATGQTALWTGINGAEITGRHISGFPTFTLKKIIQKYSILKILKENGISGGFLNCYSPPFFEHMKSRPHHLPASTLVQLAAGYSLNTLENLKDNSGIYMDITNEYLKIHHNADDPALQYRDPYRAGSEITAIKGKEILLFEYFLTDKAGHDKDWKKAEIIIGHLEAFLTGIMENMNETDQLIVSSDHGNMEDLSTSYHTKNPVPTILYGKHSEKMRKRINSLTDIPKAIYEIFGLNVRLSVDSILIVFFIIFIFKLNLFA